jgi:hypothetical protein
MEMPCISWQNDDAARRIRLEFIGVKLITQAYVENARNHCVNAILGMPVGH